VKDPAEYPDLCALLESLNHEVSAGHLALPLTATNIYETYKINDPIRRHDLALVQASLSGGLVFRGRYRRLEAEIIEVLRDAQGLPPVPCEENWFLSYVFFEAFAEWDDERLGLSIPESIINIIRSQPARHLYEYLVDSPDEVRIAAVKKFSDGSEHLRQQIEDRRSQHANESLSLRRKIYSANLMINEIELVIRFANKAGIACRTVTDIGGENVRRITREVPTYYVEREMALRLEAQTRPIDENDFRDMQSFCAIIPYADEVVGENQFVNLAKQAKLDKKYDTRITTNILELKESLKQLKTRPAN
jgi:hypothetical protein